MPRPQTTNQLAAGIRRAPSVRRAATPRLRNLELAYEADIRTLLTAFRETVSELLFPVLELISPPQPPRFDDPQDVIQRVFASLRVAIGQLIQGEPKRIAEKTSERVASVSQQQFRGLLKSVLRVEPLISEPWLISEMDAFVKENISLISSVPTEGLVDIEQMLYRDARRKLSPTEMRKRIVEQFDVTEDRARLIARDQVAKFNGSLSEIRQTSLGVEEYIWRTSDDGRVRPDHARLSGQTFRWDDPPITVRSGKRAGERNHPGRDIQCRCVRADLPIYSPSGYSVGWRRRYRGHLTILHLEKGEPLAVTPNHPLVTTGGLIAANHVDVGDCLLAASDESLSVWKDDPHNRPSSGDQIFFALAQALGIDIRPGERGQFHGDGSDGEVEVVSANVVLPGILDADRIQVLREFILTFADKSKPCPMVHGHSISPFITSGFSDRVVGSVCQFATFLLSQSGHPHQHRAATVAWLYACGYQSLSDSPAIYAQITRDLLLAFSREVTTHDRLVVELLAVVASGNPVRDQHAAAAQVARDGVLAVPDRFGGIFKRGAIAHKTLRVVDRSDRDYDGHVVNFQTGMGFYYSSGGAMLANCWSEPVLAGLLRRP